MLQDLKIETKLIGCFLVVAAIAPRLSASSAMSRCMRSMMPTPSSTKNALYRSVC